MAQIFLRGQRQPIEVDDKIAEELEDKWVTRKLENVIKIGGVAFNSSEIKSIQVIPTFLKKKKKEFDLNNKESKDKIKVFEQEFIAWLEKNPKMKENPYSHLQWYQELGAIRIKKRINDYAIKDIKMFKNLQIKWETLQSLRKMRKKAENIQEKEEIDINKISF